MSDYSVPDNISARRHLIRAVRESMISMEQREASKRKEWDNEIQKLSTLNTEAAQLIINIESNVQRLCVVCQDREKSVILMPCRHMCLCRECSNHSTLNSCPKCRSIIARRISVFIWVNSIIIINQMNSEVQVSSIWLGTCCMEYSHVALWTSFYSYLIWCVSTKGEGRLIKQESSAMSSVRACT